MECGQEYAFTSPDQFWNELDDLIRVPEDSPLEELDYALRNYIAFASRYMDEYLSQPGALAHAVLMLLDAPLFTSHVDRMIDNVVSSIADPSASSKTLFISLILTLFLRDSTNPLTALTQASSTKSASNKKGKKKSNGTGITVGSSKIFRRMRRRWSEVVPVLMKWVWDAAVVEVDQSQPDQVPQVDGAGKVRHLGMPAEGWEERVGTTATAVLYEMCRVQKLDPEELADFSFEFVSHLFALVERTRDAADETFNYTLIKLIIALNEQFMVSAVPVVATGQGKLPPPILPTVVGTHKRERGPNTVLEVLKEKEHESKTFGENVIFILNRADNTPDSLCVSLLILKILYLLFTTSGTQEYFYTNDLCVLVDVFIRELYNLGEDSEGLKHTYLRVLHPLLNNTQLRQYPYKRQELRRCLESLLEGAQYREVDSTTRRLVERNLRGTWCQGLQNSDPIPGSPHRHLGATSSTAAASTVSVDAVAVADEEDSGSTAKGRRHHRRPSGSSTTSAKPDRKSRKHASADDLRHHRMLGDGSQLPATIRDGHERLEPVAAKAIRGDPHPVVEASYAEHYSQSPTTASASLSDDAFSPHEVSRAQFDGAETVRSASAGHDMLRPIAERHLALNAPMRPSSATDLARSVPASAAVLPEHEPVLQHPRPRSSSLSVACHNSLGLSHYHTSAPPTPPLPVPASPALSNVSLAGSTDSADPTSPSSRSGAASAPRRRRPPPPPTSSVETSGSRPMTPVSRSSTAGTTESTGPLSVPPGHARRRPPPPPPKPGRDKSPLDSASGEPDARRLLDSLAVSS
ncbi:hypothetical protein BMF94_6086 [Rhodotorula taiwanensis]|uniref:SPIN90/Ldb17 leucine-rich domain-containing protein n=1 Tax=Rhodotorula taiwanensis TaxID=741276 RepID=A0A2S5B297_9BASI|nr:hypothetical protein BMF94_6086 [Rhodotorula taiwanensis]